MASSLENHSDHFSSRSLSSSDLGLLLDFFLLLGLGDSSALFFLPVRVSDFLTVFSLSTHPNTLTCEGSTRVGVAETYFSFLIFPLSIGGGSKLKNLLWGKSLADWTITFEGTRMITNPLVSTSCALEVAIKQSHNMATCAFLLTRRRHNDQYFSRNM